MKIFILSFLILISCAVFADSQSKVLILYGTESLAGPSTASAIEDAIHEQSPKSEIVSVNIDEHLTYGGMIDRRIQKIMRAVAPTFTKNLENNNIFVANHIMSLPDLGSSIDEPKILKLIQDAQATTVVATDTLSAYILGNLRDRGELRNIRLIWVNNQPLVGHRPRLSQRLDNTFVASPQQYATWLNSGVPASKVTNASLINPDSLASSNRSQKLQGIALDLPTVVVDGNNESATTVLNIVKQLSDVSQFPVSHPLQIVVIAKMSDKNNLKLNHLAANISKNSKIIILPDLNDGEIEQVIKDADVLLSKSEELVPLNDFKTICPIILYGYEKASQTSREVSRFLDVTNTAIINRDPSRLGKDVIDLIKNYKRQLQIRQAQVAYSNTAGLKTIVNAVTDSSNHALPEITANFGVMGGTSVDYSITNSFEKLDADAPHDIEILLSYGKSTSTSYWHKPYPGGHLAIRINGTVYTINGNAIVGKDPRIVHEDTLQEYLYGVTQHYVGDDHTGVTGQAYARHVLSYRVKGVTPERIQKMLEEVTKVNQEWREGKYVFSFKSNNCASFVDRLLKSAGIDTTVSKQRSLTFPLDIFSNYLNFFDKVLRVFDKDNMYRVELVSYTRVQDSQNQFKTTGFPISFYQIKKTLRRVFFQKLDAFEKRATKRVSVYAGSRVPVYENMSGTSYEDAVKRYAGREENLKSKMRVLKELEAKLEAKSKILGQMNITAESLQSDINAVFKEMTAKDQRDFAEGNFNNMLPAMRTKAIALKARIVEWVDVQREFQKQLDQFIIEQQNYFADALYTSTGKLYREIQFYIPYQEYKRLNRLHFEFKEAYRTLVRTRDLYGGPKDLFRTAAYREFFVSARNLTSQVEIFRQPGVISLRQRIMNQIANSLPQLFRFIKFVLPLIPKMGPVLSDLIFATPPQPGKETPIVAANKVFKTIGDKLGYKVEIEGQENIPAFEPTSRSKTVNVFTPTHHDPIHDFIIMSNLVLDNPSMQNHLIYSAAYLTFPNLIAQAVDKNSSVVVVGTGSDKPIQKTLEQLNSGTSRTLFIYPQGSADSGFSEINPIKEKFSWGLIQRMIDEGYEVNIIPITYENAGRFAGESGLHLEEMSTPNKVLRARIHRPINSKMTKSLLKLGGSQALNYFIRDTWLRASVTDEEHLHGQLRTKAVTDRLGEKYNLDEGMADRCYRKMLFL